jgi:large subunit ribosomal protein L15
MKPKKRLGRGYGSGKGGHTVGRGAKGNKARGKIPIWFEGGQLPLIRRLPFKRGKDRFGALNPKPVGINVQLLNRLPPGSKVTGDILVKYGLITTREAALGRVKILGQGKLDRKLTVGVPVSAGAAKKITQAGGSV